MKLLEPEIAKECTRDEDAFTRGASEKDAQPARHQEPEGDHIAKIYRSCHRFDDVQQCQHSTRVCHGSARVHRSRSPFTQIAENSASHTSPHLQLPQTSFGMLHCKGMALDGWVPICRPSALCAQHYCHSAVVTASSVYGTPHFALTCILRHAQCGGPRKWILRNERRGNQALRLRSFHVARNSCRAPCRAD